MKREKADIEKICAVCEYSQPLMDEDHVLCRKKGVVSEFYKCRAFIYDPLKRLPSQLIRPAPAGMPVSLDDAEQLTLDGDDADE